MKLHFDEEGYYGQLQRAQSFPGTLICRVLKPKQTSVESLSAVNYPTPRLAT